MPENNWSLNINTENYKFTLSIQADFTMVYVWIYNDLGFDYFSQLDTNYTIVSLSTGIYNLLTGNVPDGNVHSFILKQNINVTGNYQINLIIEEANYNNTYFYKKISNDINNYAFADIDYYLPDSILQSTSKQIFTFMSDY